MNARVTYEMHYLPHPWDEKLRKDGAKAWILCEVVVPEAGPETFNPVAIFNYDSEGARFQGHVFASGLNGKLVKIDPSTQELFELQAKLRARDALRTT